MIDRLPDWPARRPPAPGWRRGPVVKGEFAVPVATGRSAPDSCLADLNDLATSEWH